MGSFVFPYGTNPYPEQSGTATTGQTLGTPENPWEAIYVYNLPFFSGNSSSGAGVSSLNGETGAVTLVAGSNITITPSGQNITISSTGGGSGNPFSFNEIPSGLINSSNSTYTLANAPINNSLELYYNGLLLDTPDDFTLSTLTISMVSPPVTSSKLIATYEYAGSASYNWIFNEIPSGLINSSNVTYTLVNTPTNLQLFYNGLLMQVGAGNDFTISSNTITFLFAPVTGSKLIATYTY